MVISMTILKGRIPRRNALGVLGGAMVAACQGGTAAQTPVTVGASVTSQSAAPPAAPVALSPADFSRWLDGARAEALKRGIGSSTVQTALTGIEPLPKVVELDRRQPEFVNTFSRYLGNAVSERRVSDGKAKLAEHATLLRGIAQDYDIPARFIVAFWGLETSYGRIMGDFPVVTALATLAFDGRREKFFRDELFNALTILDRGHISLAQMKGSWAGAMGNTQFMPSTFLRHAVDRDGDTHINLWGSIPDALASAANYLRSMNWEGGRTWGREVRMPAGFDVALTSLDVDAKENIQPLAVWSDLGIRRADGGDLPRQDVPASLVLPQGARGPAFLVYENYRTILRWNRSAFYAIAVGHLADRLIGGPALAAPGNPAEPLRREDVLALQEGLIGQRFLEGSADGVMGSGTRQAIRRFQKAKGLVPDGFADRALISAVVGA